jgi:hypothetical protein
MLKELESSSWLLMDFLRRFLSPRNHANKIKREPIWRKIQSLMIKRDKKKARMSKNVCESC